MHQHKEQQLTATHISLYMALFQYWNYHRFPPTFTLYRNSLMRLSGIGSRSTYLKCLKELHNQGYLQYHPAKNTNRPSVSMFTLDVITAKEKTEQGPVKSGPGPGADMDILQLKIGSLPGPDVDPFNKTVSNRVNRESQTLPPAQEQVLLYFQQVSYPEQEAFKFFAHYQANGWMLGGRTPIVNWQAAADKWMRNENKIKNNNHANNSHTPQNKDYDKPF
ncbi:hypothetical protein [Chitinophaga sp. GbtcB8]|uniref:hypothetical protein n=1 Tax=Chitinophaga sp. GbtcB8 TaxID=2824753 RepID=UPI001C2F77B9|nr:hypothetical protein [Chitinophaga sp. GbtcB8]